MEDPELLPQASHASLLLRLARAHALSAVCCSPPCPAPCQPSVGVTCLTVTTETLLAPTQGACVWCGVREQECDDDAELDDLDAMEQDAHDAYFSDDDADQTHAMRHQRPRSRSRLARPPLSPSCDDCLLRRRRRRRRRWWLRRQLASVGTCTHTSLSPHSFLRLPCRRSLRMW